MLVTVGVSVVGTLPGGNWVYCFNFFYDGDLILVMLVRFPGGPLSTCINGILVVVESATTLHDRLIWVVSIALHYHELPLRLSSRLLAIVLIGLLGGCIDIDNKLLRLPLATPFCLIIVGIDAGAQRGIPNPVLPPIIMIFSAAVSRHSGSMLLFVIMSSR